MANFLVLVKIHVGKEGQGKSHNHGFGQTPSVIGKGGKCLPVETGREQAAPQAHGNQLFFFSFLFSPLSFDFPSQLHSTAGSHVYASPLCGGLTQQY